MTTQVTLTITPIEAQPAFRLISLKGQIDESNLPEVKGHIDPLVDDGEIDAILFHFQDLEFINSRVIGYFLSLYSKMNELEKNLAIVEANPNIMEILSLVGLTTLITHYDTLAEALEALGDESGQE